MVVQNTYFHKIFLIFSLSLLFLGIVYASGLFSSSLPPSPTWVTFSGRLANMFQMCTGNDFVKGFDVNYNRVCVPYNSPTSSAVSPGISGGYPAVPTWGMPGGKFGTYFKNLANVCVGNGVLQGFTSQGQKICVSALDRSTLTENPSLVSYGTPIVPSPTSPGWEPSGGKFQSYFTNMFTSSCSANQGIKGFYTNGSPSCANIPVDGLCGVVNGGNLYAAPSTGFCSKWNATGVSWGGPWYWSCSGLDGGVSVACSANKKVDGGWSAWSVPSACSVACGGGTQSQNRTCTNPSPANGGVACAGSSSQTLSCNTGSCTIGGGSCTLYTSGVCAGACGNGTPLCPFTWSFWWVAWGGPSCSQWTVKVINSVPAWPTSFTCTLSP